MGISCDKCGTNHGNFYMFPCNSCDEYMIHLCSGCASECEFRKYVCPSCERNKKIDVILDGGM